MPILPFVNEDVRLSMVRLEPDTARACREIAVGQFRCHSDDPSRIALEGAPGVA
jgi:hypothetical protein